MLASIRIIKRFIPILLILGILLGPATVAYSQGSDEEPNNTCDTAQDIGAIELPFTLNGSLDVPDVDFFLFTGEPATGVRVDLEGDATGQGTLIDPLLGLFDSGCNLIAFNDDNFETLNSTLIFIVPPDGVFILAATSFPDFEFIGDGSPGGTYLLTIAEQPLAGSISGRVVDAADGTPLSGINPPFAFVELYRCIDEGCFEFVNFSIPNDDGQFFFFSSIDGQPLLAGSYQVVAAAEGYQQGQSEIFALAEDEQLDIGDVPLLPIPVQVTDVTPCEELPSQGGTCLFTVQFTNVTSEPIRGAAWSLVDAFEIGSPLNFTLFQPMPPQNVTLRPGGSAEVSFSFRVPGTVSDGAFICTQVFVGEGRRSPYFNTVGQGFLFCIVKGLDGFSVAQGLEGRQLFAGRLQRLYAPDRHSLPEMLKKEYQE